MINRAILFGLLLGVVVGMSGCCGVHQGMYSPFGPGTLCDPSYCEPTCGVECCEPCECCDPCETCCDPCSDPCCDPCCGPPCGPLTWLFAIFQSDYRHGGCGERYWGDFHGDPPYCCEPCDRMGNWTDRYGYDGMASGTRVVDHGPRVLAGTERDFKVVSDRVVSDTKVATTDRVKSTPHATRPRHNRTQR